MRYFVSKKTIRGNKCRLFSENILLLRIVVILTFSLKTKFAKAEAVSLFNFMMISSKASCFCSFIDEICYALVEEKIDLIMDKLKITHSDESITAIQVSAELSSAQYDKKK